jgi:hypothetical protein
VLGGPNTYSLAPTYSVFTTTGASDGTNGTQNRAGTATDFQRAYANGANGANGQPGGGSLKQLVFAVEQSVVKGAPVLEVQAPTVATTAAAFDEGGNFIDVRFGPLTRGYCNPNVTGATCSQAWSEFAIYNPTSTAITTDFVNGLRVLPNTANYVSTLLQRDRNLVPRPTTNIGNWVRGAFMQ